MLISWNTTNQCNLYCDHCYRPFEKAARQLGLSEDEVLGYLRRWQREGIIRRFGAALRHREADIEANAMIVWRVPPEQIQFAGRRVASFPEVTHCYQRKTAPGWPYNLFAMVHGETREQCEALARKLAAAIDNHNYRILFSTTELKKESMRYFSD